MPNGPQPHLWTLKVSAMMDARARYLKGRTIRELASEYHVSYGTMQSIISGRHPAIRWYGGVRVTRTRGGKNVHG